MTAKHPDSERQKRHAAMLKEALSRPGVSEYMEVYQVWQERDSGLNAYRSATTDIPKISATNHANISDSPR